MKTSLKLIAIVLSVVALVSGCADAGEPNTEVPVSVSFADTDLELNINATSVIRNADPVPSLAYYGDEEETVAVKIEATLGEKYVTSFSGNALRLLTDDGTEEYQTLDDRFPGRQTEVADTQNAAGRPPLALVSSGQSGSGWVYFNIEPKGAEKLTLRYVRPDSRVISAGQSQTLPAKNVDVVLQAPTADS